MELTKDYGPELVNVLSELESLRERKETMLRRGRRRRNSSRKRSSVNVSLAPVQRAIETKTRELRAIFLGMPKEDWDGAMAACREACPEALAKFLDWLGLPQSPAEG